MTAPIEATAPDVARRSGRVLRLVRQSRRMSQAELAARAELTRSTISRLENEVEAPQRRTVLRLAAALQWDAAELFPEHDGADQ